MELYSLNFPNGKRYLGISHDTLGFRWKKHRRSSLKGKLPVHRVIRKYGTKTVEVQVLCIGTEEYIKELEIKAIAAYQTQDRRFGYNLSPGGQLGRLGLKNTPEHNLKISQANSGSNNGMFGKALTQEHRDRLSLSHKGRGLGIPKTEETKAKIKAARARQVITPESNLKRSLTLANRFFSEEHRRKLSEASKRQWAERKAK